MRQSGILMHITSLPGPGGIGSLGAEAYAFADFLKDSGVGIWQVLPLGPTGYGESPYQSASVYAGNPMLISCASLREEGLLSYEDTEEYQPPCADRIDYDQVRAHKEPLLRRCFAVSGQKLRAEVDAFCREQPWVEDFALFTALKARFGGVMWTRWPDEALRLRRPEALERSRRELSEEIRYHLFCQYLFFRQWRRLKRYCNGLGIRLFGDMPIYVAEDSADTWTHPEVFQLDGDRKPKRVAGVPPDFFSADGQLWGNPLYRWHSLRLHRYGWWVERMRAMAQMYDIVRIDHFIGFANYYSVPQGAPNARSGRWIIGPGKHLFRRLQKELPGLCIVAEDLGCVNDRVRRLLKYVGYPGMRVLSFGFGGDAENPHLPANYPANCVAYTGTHDNDTVAGWLTAASPEALAQAQALLGFTDPADGPAAFVRAVLESAADTAVLPMQDVLALGSDARMNTPGTIGGNWMWRMPPDAATPQLAARLAKLNQATDRRMGNP